MIHDAIVEVTCDNSNCTESVFVSPEYVYHSTSGKSGQYDTSPTAIEKALVSEHEWVVRESFSQAGGKHYCCEECAEEAQGGGDDS